MAQADNGQSRTNLNFHYYKIFIECLFQVIRKIHIEMHALFTYKECRHSFCDVTPCRLAIVHLGFGAA
jgi:hypothetical protein